jgi:hypothetical protein
MLEALSALFDKWTLPTVMPLHCHISNRIMPLQFSHSYYEYMMQSSTPHPHEGATSPIQRRQLRIYPTAQRNIPEDLRLAQYR